MRNRPFLRPWCKDLSCVHRITKADLPMTTTAIGKKLRMPFLYERSTPIVIAPIDDYLIFGPRDGLENPLYFLKRLNNAKPDAILTHAGLVQSCPAEFIGSRVIINLTASTVLSNHAAKRVIHGIETALRLNAVGVACHINIGSNACSEMIEQAGNVVEKANRYDLPVVGIVYPRDDRVKSDDELYARRISDPDGFSQMIAHCVSVGVSLGFDLIKLWYTGDVKTFAPVVLAAGNVPIVIAGGRRVPAEQALTMASDAVFAGASGVSFGRNLFGRDDPAAFIKSVRSIKIQ